MAAFCISISVKSVTLNEVLINYGLVPKNTFVVEVNFTFLKTAMKTSKFWGLFALQEQPNQKICLLLTKTTHFLGTRSKALQVVFMLLVSFIDRFVTNTLT